MSWRDAEPWIGDAPGEREAAILDTLEEWLDDDDRVCAVGCAERVTLGGAALESPVWFIVSEARFIGGAHNRLRLRTIDLSAGEITDVRVISGRDGTLRVEAATTLRQTLRIELRDDADADRTRSLLSHAALTVAGAPEPDDPNSASLASVLGRAPQVAQRLAGVGTDAGTVPHWTPETLRPSPDPLDQIQKLGALRDAGLITNEEFELKKAELLNRM